MIILFDCNSYDKLIVLDWKDLQKISARITKVVIPQAVRIQLDMMIGRQDKLEKLSKINQLIAYLDILGKVEYRKSLGMNSYGKQIYFDSLPGKMRNSDKEIALTAKQEEAIMITDDKYFLLGLKFLKQPVMNFEEFLTFLQTSDVPKSSFDQ